MTCNHGNAINPVIKREIHVIKNFRFTLTHILSMRVSVDNTFNVKHRGTSNVALINLHIIRNIIFKIRNYLFLLRILI